MAVAQVEVDIKSFWERLNKVYDSWKKDSALWNDVDAIILNSGAPQEDVVYVKSTALQMWFFGYEFPETIMVLCTNNVYIHTSAKKSKILEVITTDKEAKIPVEIIPIDKEDNKPNIKKLINAIKASSKGRTIGILKKEKPTGDFISSWLKELDQLDFEQQDVASGFSELLAVKDAKELKAVKTAAIISSHVLKSELLPLIENVIDEAQTITHTQLGQKIETLFQNPASISTKLNPNFIDSCYPPIIQSGGKYDPKPGVPNNEENLDFGTIVCSIGAKFKYYCSNVARTYLVDAADDQEQTYKLLVEIFQRLLKSLKPGVQLNELYNQSVKFLESKNKQLIDKFSKNCGWVIGLEFQESAYTINAKNERSVKAGMVFNLQVAFNNIETKSTDPKKKLYSMLIADTVLVTDKETEVLTEKCPKKYSDISYNLENEPDTKEEKKKTPKKSPEKEAKQPKVEPTEKAKTQPKTEKKARATVPTLVDSKLRSSTVARQEEKNKLKEAEEKRKEHQKKLEDQKREEAEARYAAQDNSRRESNRQSAKIVQSYKDASEFPKDIQARNRLHVDMTRETVLVPMYGVLVPFHISTIKNASKTDEEYLRINFITPDSTVNIANKKTEVLPNPKDIRVKELTYRCSDARNLNNCLRQIKELRKRIVQRETERRATADLIEQEKLVLAKGRNPRLVDIFIRPSATGRKTLGYLEAHTNGLRFSSSKGENVDILYKNIKHSFFQPAENELLVIIHFHLHHAIMIGKKKTLDIQFCTEVMEVSQALDSRGKYDPDEIEDEQRERQMRAKLNNEFQNFVRKVEDVVPGGGLEFDIPYRELGFYGVPFRSQVLLQPTVNCLVHLSEPPFFVITLADVEIAHFERVQFSLKNFDLVIVFKDYERPVQHINTISTEYLDTIKEWLDSCDIKYYEGTQSLNWSRIMQTIAVDPKKFYTEDGGWSILNAEESSEEEKSNAGGSDGEENKGSEQEDGEFAPESESDEYEENESEGTGEEEEEEEADSEDYDDEEEEEEEGEDWDALEEKARLADKEMAAKFQKRGRDKFSDEESGDDRARKKSKKK